tara:strand:+ start:147 stop:668 length:522 start_codon:yes stop_codon:yes gene_type:complete
MQNLRRKLLIPLVALTALIHACGYHLVGTGNKLPSHIRSLAIPVFENLTDQPELHRNLTDAVREAFLNDARVKIVPERKADLVVKGTLSYYDVRPIAFNDQDVATQYWVKIAIDLDATDRLMKKTYLKQQLKTRWDYNANENVVDSEEARLQALKEAYQDLSLRMVSLFLDPF